MVWLPFLIWAIGIIFIVLEIFLPSMGLFTVLASISILGSIVLAFSQGPWWGLGFLLGTIFLVPIVLYAGFKLFPQTPLGKRMILNRPKAKKGEPQTFMMSLKNLEGAEGITTSSLRPSGVAELNGERVDVLTEGEMVPAKARIRVIRVSGNRVFVKEIK